MIGMRDLRFALLHNVQKGEREPGSQCVIQERGQYQALPATTNIFPKYIIQESKKKELLLSLEHCHARRKKKLIVMQKKDSFQK